MTKNIPLKSNLDEANRARAQTIRESLAHHRVLAVNLIGSPGCGKTTLLESTIPRLPELRSAVIEGDIATTRDADRIRVLGIPAVQINTGGACHLLAPLVEEALKQLNIEAMDILFIENVGNLVCPSTADLGEDFKIAVLSVPEGDDKVAKYPRLFREASCVLLNKIDLAGLLHFDVERVRGDLACIKAGLPMIELSASTGTGLDAWLEWLRARRREKNKS